MSKTPKRSEVKYNVPVQNHLLEVAIHVQGTISFPTLAHSSTLDHRLVLACHQNKTCRHKCIKSTNLLQRFLTTGFW